MSRAQKVAGAVVAVALGAIGFLPLFGGPGYEFGLASGLVVPSAAAIATALDRARDRGPSPLAGVARGVANGLALAAIAFAVALVHALRAGACDLGGGALTFALTAGIGAVAGGVWGAVAGEVVSAGHAAVGRTGRPPRRVWLILAALAGPLAGIAVSIWRFYASPMVFAFDPFFGYFSGTIYDTVIDAGTPLLTYRAGTVAAIAGVALAASVVERAPHGANELEGEECARATCTGAALHWRRAPGALARALLAASCFAASLGVLANAHALGHWQSSASIASALGETREGPRCTVHYPSGTREDEAALLVEDCEEELASVEAVLGTKGPARVAAFFFRDAAEKKRLMGAADTYIAKPWRREVYLQMHAYPHPVLGHELAHVVAGGFGRGPFKVAGGAGGLWPNPGLIEGVAVAASPDDDELTDAQWARAMMALRMLPPMKRVFGMGFLGESAAKSYTVAGAFVQWLLRTRGAEVVRAWYGGRSIEELTSASWDSLDAQFRADLEREPLAPEAEAFARAKFGRPSIFGRVCPHVVDALRQSADRCRDQGQYGRAAVLYGEALEKDAHDTASRFGRANLALRHGDAAGGRAEMERIVADADTPRTWRDRAEEALGDADLLDGKNEAAAARYRAIAARSLDEDAARTLEVKAIGATDDDARAAVVALLLGTRDRPADPFVGAMDLGAWSQRTRSALAEYLLGKNLAQRGWFALAAERLDRAIEQGAPTARIGREALRQRAVCACALGDARGIARVREALADAKNPFAGTAGGRRAAVEGLLARCGGRSGGESEREDGKIRKD